MLTSSIDSIDDNQELRSHHYAFYLPGTESSFFKNLVKGAGNAANALNCSLSFHLIDENSDSFEFAHYSGVDGLAVYLYRKDDEMRNTLTTIVNSGIPIVQIENFINLDEDTFYIGTNGFEIGKTVGTLASKLNTDSLNMALIYSEKNPGLHSTSNLIEMGIKSVLGGDVSSLQTFTTSLNPLDAEKYAYDLIRSSNTPDTIVLTDPNDTLVTVQTIIDMNQVGKIQVIGFGENEAIKEYIDKGIIMGSIVRNPYRIGYSAVMALSEISRNGYTSAYVDTGLNVITSSEDGR